MKKISLLVLSLLLVFSLSISVAAATMTEEEVIKTVGDNKIIDALKNITEAKK